MSSKDNKISEEGLLDQSTSPINSILTDEDNDEGRNSKGRFSSCKTIFFISLVVLIVVGLLIVWGFSTKKNDPINPPEPISHQSCKDFKPKIIEGLPVFNQESVEAYNAYAKKVAGSSQKVVIGNDHVGERYIDNPLTPRQTLEQFSFKVEPSKAIFGDYDKLVNHYARVCYDGDPSRTYISE